MDVAAVCSSMDLEKVFSLMEWCDTLSVSFACVVVNSYWSVNMQHLPQT